MVDYEAAHGQSHVPRRTISDLIETLKSQRRQGTCNCLHCTIPWRRMDPRSFTLPVEELAFASCGYVIHDDDHIVDEAEHLHLEKKQKLQ